MMADGMRPSVDTMTDDGTVETMASGGGHRPLSIVEEVPAYLDETVDVGIAKRDTGATPKAPHIEPAPALASAMASDATSTRSMPLLQVSRPDTPADGTESAHSPSQTVPPSPARSRHSVADEPAPSRRQAGLTRRSTVDVRLLSRSQASCP
jgi:hypothetical protein